MLIHRARLWGEGGESIVVLEGLLDGTANGVGDGLSVDLSRMGLEEHLVEPHGLSGDGIDELGAKVAGNAGTRDALRGGVGDGDNGEPDMVIGLLPTLSLAMIDDLAEEQGLSRKSSFLGKLAQGVDFDGLALSFGYGFEVPVETGAKIDALFEIIPIAELCEMLT